MSAAPTVAQALLPYTCTGCETQKQEANHWFVIWIAEYELTDHESVHAPMFAPWRHDIASAPWNAAVACGEACLHKLVSRYISTGLFTAPRSRPDAQLAKELA